MPRQDNQFSSQRSPYSAQPSPAQPSPYSTQPSPYSTQPSPYSSQPSPYSAQPSPDTSQIVKQDLQKAGAWNTGNYSPMPKHHAPFSPHPSTHASPDPGLGVKCDSLRGTPGKTPTPGQYSPMSRPQHHSPYSPRPSHLPSPARAGAQWGFNHMSTPTAGIESLVWGGSPFGAEATPQVLSTPPAPAPAPAPWPGDPWTLGQFRVEPPSQVHNTFVEQSVSFESLSAHVSHAVHAHGLPAHGAHAAHALQTYLDDGFSEASRVD